MSQTTAPRREMVEGALGLVAEPFTSHDIHSRINDTDPIFFGRAVIHDAGVGGDDGVAHPAAAPTVAQIDGVVMATRAIVSKTTGGDPQYDAQESINVIKKGYIWVAITADVVKGDPVHVLHGAGTEGKFANAGGVDISSIAKWEKGGLAADGFALLSIDMK